MKRGASIAINKEALTHNLSVVRECAPGSKILAVIKANAYGHGMLDVAQQLQHEADALAVACVDEAIKLREEGIEAELVILQGFHDQNQLEQCAEYNLQPVCHQLWQQERVLASNLNTALTIWLKIDTGMHRLGISVADLADAYRQLHSSSNVETVRLMSHFSSADEINNGKNQRQLDDFLQAVNGIDAEQSIANSAAILSHPESHLDWVRPGLMLYGVSPFPHGDVQERKLKPVMTLQSYLIAIQSVSKGESVGYGESWVAERDSVIGVVATGYGDGYPRHAINGTPVLINGVRCPLAGRVSMDMITVDLTELAAPAQIGDPVVLWGETLAVEEVAENAGTIPYELLCAAGREQ